MEMSLEIEEHVYIITQEFKEHFIGMPAVEPYSHAPQLVRINQEVILWKYSPHIKFTHSKGSYNFVCQALRSQKSLALLPQSFGMISPDHSPNLLFSTVTVLLNVFAHVTINY
ncbi:hypothetical protein TNCT_707551 [Trichonephila clavata]|uniref:Uncharacterized protein n=1 Tax=Trichonephila clavata TaxID=2740835 RepID=A0A8X6JGE6_TRICU|nr:hypothetical protein TNCT_707551 [Trichonephila clavata]